jgi:hypothetical protein
MKKPQPLGRHFGGEKIDAGYVAAGPGKARDKTLLDWIIADTEDDWDRRCRSFGRERRHIAGRGDYGDLSANDVVRPGDYIFIPANMLHVAVNRGVQPAVFIGSRNEATAQESIVLRPEMDRKVP